MLKKLLTHTGAIYINEEKKIRIPVCWRLW